MERFFYKALKRSGEEEEGVIEAASVEAAVQWVKGQGLIPVEVEPASKKRSIPFWETLKDKRRKTSPQQILLFTKQLTSLLRGGLAMDRALKVLSDSMEDLTLRNLCDQILQDIEKGASLSESLERRGGFSSMYVTLVRAGESSGTLEEVLQHLSSYLEEELKAKKEILSALIYPSLLLGAGLISAYLLLVLVIPRFSVIFEDLGQAIPLPTRIMLSISLVVRKAWWAFPLGIVGFIALFKYSLTRAEWRERWERLLLYRMPMVSIFVRKREISRFSRAMAILLRGGVPLSRALELVIGISPFEDVRRELHRITKEIKKGRNLSTLTRESHFFLPFCTHMVSVGEETGSLDEAFSNVATTYEEDIRESTTRFLNFLEPVIILFMGLLIGSMVISMLMAIFSINDIGF